MSAPRLCGDCSHPVGKHSHLVPHPCIVDGCSCESYARLSISTQEGTK